MEIKFEINNFWDYSVLKLLMLMCFKYVIDFF